MFVLLFYPLNAKKKQATGHITVQHRRKGRKVTKVRTFTNKGSLDQIPSSFQLTTIKAAILYILQLKRILREDGGVVDEVEVEEEDLKRSWEETAGLKDDKKVEEQEVNLPTRQALPSTPTQLDKLPPMTVLRPSQDTHYLEQVAVLDNIDSVCL